jgi:hypothetical protein
MRSGEPETECEFQNFELLQPISTFGEPPFGKLKLIEIEARLASGAHRLSLALSGD